MIHSYPTVFAIGHRAIEHIFDSPVIIEEKVDGSQFSMSVDPDTGELLCRSKGKQLLLDAPEKLFERAVQTARELHSELWPGWTYRCEYLSKPKHNALVYSRIPNKHLILFDIGSPGEMYLDPAEKRTEAARLGLECVPTLYHGEVSSFEMFHDFLQRESILGGCKVEGVVVKNYEVFTPEKKVAIGKYVSEAFKETQAKDWKDSNPSAKDVTQRLIETYRTEARWAKAVQHLREDGKITDSPKDIGLLIREIPDDILKEEEDFIKEALFKHHWQHIRRGVTAGVAEWYKELLAKSAFGG